VLLDRPLPFRTELAEFVTVRTYARWLDELQRREKWPETVDRATEFLFKRAGDALTEQDRTDIATAIYDHEVLPSMRLLWSAGPAAEANNIAAYNCAYNAIDDLRSFDEALFILMSGTGFGYSVESEYVEQLPRILKTKKASPEASWIIADSRFGWAEALRVGLEAWYNGSDITFDYSELRPQGARLYTMGGRSSGPEPLRRLLDFVRAKVQSRAGRRLRPIDAHDIMCVIGEAVVAGGVRRSSLISLSDLDDYDMRMAKYGAFYNTAPYRSMANNSVAYNEKPDSVSFMEEFLSLAKSGSGERGIFNREAINSTSPRRKAVRNGGTNPCAEINLRPMEFCNLSSIVARPDDTRESLTRKARLASIIGTIQSTFTDFEYLRPQWKKNCDEERLLGVSITGQMDCAAVRNAQTLQLLKRETIETNSTYASRMGINPSAAITCGKPDGTLSQVVFSGSGAHTWWGKFFLRRVRISITDPLFVFAKTIGIPAQPEVGQDPATASTWVLEFPMRAPEGSITRHDVTALDQLEHWKLMKTEFCEHNQSITVYVKNDEWPTVLSWLYEHWKIVGGLSFLPSEDHVYRLAPYEEITEDEYYRLKQSFPVVDYALLDALEHDDNTTGARDYACVSGNCEI
jgi:ribonucleoside-triphosphate reductase